MTGDSNPYKAPGESPSSATDDLNVARDASGRLVLASRGSRLAAVLIDFLFHFLFLLISGAVIGLLFHGELLTYGKLFDRTPGLRAPLVLGAAVAVLAIQAMLITRRGQTIGKIVMRTRIVHGDGRIPDLYRGVVLRTLPVQVLSWLPMIGYALGSSNDPSGIGFAANALLFVDTVLIFGAARQCGHDRLAGTFVAVSSAGSAGELPPITPERPRKKKKKGKRKASNDEPGVSVRSVFSGEMR